MEEERGAKGKAEGEEGAGAGAPPAKEMAGRGDTVEGEPEEKKNGPAVEPVGSTTKQAAEAEGDNKEKGQSRNWG